MMPAVPAPKNAGISIPVELKLKRNYSYDSRKRVFESSSGTRFNPFKDLPKDTRIVYKVPALAAADEAKLSESERELRRYMQVILPPGAAPQDYVDAVRAWPGVEEASVGPDVSLPGVR
jgi:hypothetical protein